MNGQHEALTTALAFHGASTGKDRPLYRLAELMGLGLAG
jgi:hypothetical protein